MPADKWIGQQFAFENDAELKGQVDVEDGDIERRGMSDGVDAGFGVVELVCSSGNSYRRQDCLHDEPRPEAGEIVLEADVAVEERDEQRERAENYRVGPDERIKDEIRTQAAGPAVAVFER